MIPPVGSPFEEAVQFDRGLAVNDLELRIGVGASRMSGPLVERHQVSDNDRRRRLESNVADHD